VNRLVRLYPRWWRERHGEEFTDLVAALAAERGRLRLAADIVRGALDAHLSGRPDMKDVAVRRGVWSGLAIVGVLEVVFLLSNVVFPRSPDASDDDPEYLAQILAAYVLLAVVFGAIGAYARRGDRTPWAGVKAGAAAGIVVALGLTVVSLVIDNAFLGIVSQQHDKRVAFAASGWASMRAYLTVRTILGAFVLTPAFGVVGAALGGLGGAIFRNRAGQPDPVA